MRSPILMPEVGDDSPALNLWYAQPGEHVYAGDRVAELLLECATFDVCAPVDGRLTAKIAQPGQHFAPGQILGWIEADEDEPTSSG